MDIEIGVKNVKKSTSNNFVYTEDIILICNICEEIKDYDEMCKKGTCKPIYCKNNKK
jgi:hypothetical protein